MPGVQPYPDTHCQAMPGIVYVYDKAHILGNESRVYYGILGAVPRIAPYLVDGDAPGIRKIDMFLYRYLAHAVVCIFRQFFNRYFAYISHVVPQNQQGSSIFPREPQVTLSSAHIHYINQHLLANHYITTNAQLHS